MNLVLVGETARGDGSRVFHSMGTVCMPPSGALHVPADKWVQCLSDQRPREVAGADIPILLEIMSEGRYASTAFTLSTRVSSITSLALPTYVRHSLAGTARPLIGSSTMMYCFGLAVGLKSPAMISCITSSTDQTTVQCAYSHDDSIGMSLTL